MARTFQTPVSWLPSTTDPILPAWRRNKLPRTPPAPPAAGAYDCDSKPTSSNTKAEIVAWIETGDTELSDAALNALNKTELLSIVSDICDGD